MTKVLLVAVAELIKVAVPLQVLLWADAAVQLLLVEQKLQVVQQMDRNTQAELVVELVPRAAAVVELAITVVVAVTQTAALTAVAAVDQVTSMQLAAH
jgi:hypothetical protein